MGPLNSTELEFQKIIQLLRHFPGWNTQGIPRVKKNRLLMAVGDPRLCKSTPPLGDATSHRFFCAVESQDSASPLTENAFLASASLTPKPLRIFCGQQLKPVFKQQKICDSAMTKGLRPCPHSPLLAFVCSLISPQAMRAPALPVT